MDGPNLRQKVCMWECEWSEKSFDVAFQNLCNFRINFSHYLHFMFHAWKLMFRIVEAHGIYTQIRLQYSFDLIVPYLCFYGCWTSFVSTSSCLRNLKLWVPNFSSKDARVGKKTTLSTHPLNSKKLKSKCWKRLLFISEFCWSGA